MCPAGPEYARSGGGLHPHGKPWDISPLLVTARMTAVAHSALRISTVRLSYADALNVPQGRFQCSRSKTGSHSPFLRNICRSEMLQYKRSFSYICHLILSVRRPVCWAAASKTMEESRTPLCRVLTARPTACNGAQQKRMCSLMRGMPRHDPCIDAGQINMRQTLFVFRRDCLPAQC